VTPVNRVTTDTFSRMSNPHETRSTRRTGRTAYLAGALLVVVALVLCGGGAALFAGSAARGSQDGDVAVIGLAVFDMHEGDEYWIYQPVGGTWGDQVECRFGEPYNDEPFELRRTERPFGAPETRTDSGDVYTFYGTLRGDRTASVLIECPSDRYLVAPNQVPGWYLLAALGGGVVTGLLGLLVLVVAVVRHRPRRTATAPAAAAFPGPVPAAATFPGPVPAAATFPGPVPAAGTPPAPVPGGPAPRKRPSPLWYVAMLPFVFVSLLACMIGVLGGWGAGFSDSFEPPEVGQPRTGTVYDAYRYDFQYLLYADVAEAPPAEPVTCLLISELPQEEVIPLEVRTDRPLAVPETLDYEGETYQFVGTFQLPDPILGTVTCEGESTLLTKPGNRPQLMMVIGLSVAFGALLLAAAIGIILSLRRRR
jgi:hypothetical protein